MCIVLDAPGHTVHFRGVSTSAEINVHARLSSQLLGWDVIFTDLGIGSILQVLQNMFVAFLRQCSNIQTFQWSVLRPQSGFDRRRSRTMLRLCSVRWLDNNFIRVEYVDIDLVQPAFMFIRLHITTTPAHRMERLVDYNHPGNPRINI